jgi:beta-phosphoglucomutase
LDISDLKVIVFDFDGVIVESVQIKTDAYRELFSSYKDRIDEIMAYHYAHYSLSRFVQFPAIVKDILHQEYTPEFEAKLDREFSRLVVEKIIQCPFVPGAMDLLKYCFNKWPMYVVSLTPEKELERILSSKGVNAFLKGYYGSAITKVEAIRRIRETEHISSQQILFIGDSLSDLKSATEAGVLFIARAHDRAFEGRNVPAYSDLKGIHDHCFIKESS